MLLVTFSQRRAIREQQRMLAKLKEREEALTLEVRERRQAQKLARDLSNRILDAQEDERRRVSRELHDGIIQLLSSVQFRLGLRQGTSLRKKAFRAIELRKANTLVEKAIDETRRIAHDLRPSVLDDLGLATAVFSLCEEFTKKTGIPVDVKLPRRLKRLPGKVELTLFRLFQEALNNVEKHSRARQVEISLHRENSSIRAHIRDDGRGFVRKPVLKKKHAKNGLGLAGMQERIVSVGGLLKIESQPRRGTRIDIMIPLT